eukprot:COSAG06_NODE_2868_length_6151_cov_6.454891_6_plen_157_part_00
MLALLYVPETLPAAQGRNVCACFCALCGGGSGGGSGKRGEGAYGKLATEDTDGEEGAESGSATRDNDAAAQKAAEKKPGPCALMSRRVPAVAILAYVLQVRMPAMLSILMSVSPRQALDRHSSYLPIHAQVCCGRSRASFDVKRAFVRAAVVYGAD